MRRAPPGVNRTDTLHPYTTLCRSGLKLAAIKGLGDLVGRLALRTGFHGARDRVHELLSRNIDPGKIGALAPLLHILGIQRSIQHAAQLLLDRTSTRLHSSH